MFVTGSMLRTSSYKKASNPSEQSVAITLAPDETSAVSSELRTITDLAGNEVKIPAVSEIRRVVITSGPLMSFVVETIPDTEMIVGINSRAFTTSNTKIVGKLFPKEEWNRTNERPSELLENQTETKTALCIFSNAAGTITVNGMDSFDAYAQSFFDKVGIQNSAAGVKGTAEVNMEQIYEWNPDMINFTH